MTRTTRAIFILILGLGLLTSPGAVKTTEAASPAVSDREDQKATVSRLYGCLLTRESRTGTQYGADALDPLLWQQTEYLILGRSHVSALTCLDEFLNTHAEKTLRDPVIRAMVQRDLWAIFDWSAQGSEHLTERQELQVRLAQVLQRLEMDERTLNSLPDTYSATLKSGQLSTEYDRENPKRPFLPADLLKSGSPWVCVIGGPTAIIHTEQFSGRSRFLVFIHLPGGRKSTLDYLHQLHQSGQPLFSEEEAPGPHLNLELPQFPAGTMVALVRQLNLFNNRGALAATPITESVQIRVYHSVTPGSRYMNYIGGPSSHDQEFFEFRLNKEKVLAGKEALLEPVSPDQTEYSTFMTHGVDPFEAGPNDRRMAEPGKIMNRCIGCHADSGIHSVQSRAKLVPPNPEQADPRNADPKYGAFFWETEATLDWKRKRFDWGLLNGYWSSFAMKPR